MLILTTNNSTSQLDGLTIPQYRSLRKVLSYKVEGGYYGGGHNGGMRYLLTKRGEYPSGLTYKVLQWLKENKLPYQHTSLMKRPTAKPGLFKAKQTLVPYPEQELAVKRCLLARKGTVVMPTGSGKSITMALLVNALQLRTLIVVPNLNLKTQLTETFTKIFGARGMRNITIQNIDSKSLHKASDYDVLIIDEAHHVAASTYRNLNRGPWKGIYHRFFFTATPFRGQEEELILMEAIAGRIIYRLPYKQAVANGLICPIEAYYYEVPKTTTRSQTWAAAYKELVVNNEPRNAIIATLLKALRYANASALCLVKEVAHGYILADNIPFAHGENEDTQSLINTFNRGGSCLVATTGVCGEGTDTKPCEYVVLAGLGKSKPALIQAFGRAFRTYPGKTSGKIIIFLDKSHKWSKAHFKAQCKVLLEEFGVTPIKLSLDS